MVGTSLRNSTSLISFPVRKPGQMEKLRYTQMKLIIVTGNRCKTIILIGGAQYISEVVRNLKFAVNCFVSPCPSYLFSLTSSTQMYGAVPYNDIGGGKPSFATWENEGSTSQCFGLLVFKDTQKQCFIIVA